jgi:hypothetical protein
MAKISNGCLSPVSFIFLYLWWSLIYELGTIRDQMERYANILCCNEINVVVFCLKQSRQMLIIRPRWPQVTETSLGKTASRED